MDEFIEVVGSAAVVETLVEHRVALTLTVRAPQADNVVGFASLLRDECIKVLLHAGLLRTELSEGGGEIGQVYWWRAKKEREKEREASHKILIACTNIGRVTKALAALEPLFESKKYSLNVSTMTPRFEATDGDKASGQRAAIEHARSQANTLALASGATLGHVLQIEQLDAQRSRSGAYGDEDYGRLYSPMESPIDDEPEELDPAKRKQTCTYRVRFAIAHE